MATVAKELGIEISGAQSRYNSKRTMFFKYLRTVRGIDSGSERSCDKFSSCRQCGWKIPKRCQEVSFQISHTEGLCEI